MPTDLTCRTPGTLGVLSMSKAAGLRRPAGRPMIGPGGNVNAGLWCLGQDPKLIGAFPPWGNRPGGQFTFGLDNYRA